MTRRRALCAVCYVVIWAALPLETGYVQAEVRTAATAHSDMDVRIHCDPLEGPVDGERRRDHSQPSARCCSRPWRCKSYGACADPLSQQLPFFAYPFLAAALFGWAWVHYRNAA